MISDEMKALVTISRHITTVQKHLHSIIEALEKRARLHDLSKLSLDEFGGFVEINQIAREHPYGSEEYRESLKGNKTIKLHFSQNSHHPEYYPNGMADMSLLDIIEMVCDWKAASETYGQTSFEDSLEIQCKRFGLSEEQLRLIRMVVALL